MTIRTTRRKQFLPYRDRSEGLDLTFRNIQVDGRQREVRIEESRRLIRLEGVEENWGRLSIEGILTVPSTIFGNVIGPYEQTDPPVRAGVDLRCGRTYLRKTHLIAMGKDAAGEHQFEILFNRKDVRGTVEIIPTLTRIADRPGQSQPIDAEGYAQFKGALLASDRPWEVRIDADDALSGQHLDVRYESFKDTDNLPPQDRIYYIDLSRRKNPILVLNSDHDEIQRILDSEATWGVTARIRDTIFDQISYAVWHQLLIQSALDIDHNGDVRYDWQDGVLDRFIPKLYPSIGDQKTARLALRHEVRSELGELTPRLDDAIQVKLDLRKQMKKLIGDALST